MLVIFSKKCITIRFYVFFKGITGYFTHKNCINIIKVNKINLIFYLQNSIFYEYNFNVVLLL